MAGILEVAEASTEGESATVISPMYAPTKRPYRELLLKRDKEK